MRPKVELRHPERIMKAEIWQAGLRHGLPYKVFKRIAWMAVLWLVNKQTSHGCETYGESVLIAQGNETKEADN